MPAKKLERMKRTHNLQRKEKPCGPIVEIMLAKAVLEEKNELLDKKERLIGELRSKQKELESELEQCKAEMSVTHKTGLQEGIHSIVEEVVRIAADYDSQDGGVSSNLASRLIRIFHERYGLEVLEGVPNGIDPEIHRVIELNHNPEVDSSIQVLSRGFKIAGKVIRPVLVKVIRGRS